MGLIYGITVNVARYFIEEKASIDINYRLVGLDLPINSPTFLHIAIYKSDEELFDYCMQKGADITINLEKYGSPLHLAVYTSDNNLNILEKLIGAGANLHGLECVHDWSPLHVACLYGKYAAAEMLINNGANVNIITANQLDHPLRHGSTPLHLAIERNHNDIVVLLCENDADLEIHARNRGRPLFFAAVKGHCNILSTLLEYGANINALSTIYGYPYTLVEVDGVSVPREFVLTALHGAVDRQINEIVRVLLIHRNIDVNSSVERFQTPLHCAVESRSDTIVFNLLNFGGDINVRSNNRKSLIEHCLEKNTNHDYIKLTIIEVLRNHIIKLQCIGWDLSHKNTVEARSDIYRSYRQQCVQEVYDMREHFIGVSNITVHDLLDCSRNLSYLLRQFTGYNIFCEGFKYRYPLYYTLIRYRLLRYLQANGHFLY